MISHLFLRDDGLGDGGELNLTVIAQPGDGAAAVFGRVAEVLRAHRGFLLIERVISADAVDAGLRACRSAAYGDLDDGVVPTWLGSPAGRTGQALAVQVHAVTGRKPTAVGRYLRVAAHPRRGVAVLSGVAAPGEGPGAVFAQAADLLAGVDVPLRRVGRTWLWLDPIYEEYAALNRDRTACFIKHGLIAADRRPLHLPASTGIGLRPAQAGMALEAIAPLGDGQPRPLEAAGNQDSAFAYGSAFSRAIRMPTPGGETFYVSGTAAIDTAGRTVAVGDIQRQVALTIDNVRAVLRDLGCDENTLVNGTAYAINPAVLAAWHAADPGWPLAPVLADICRPDLLFEIEVTAWPGAIRG